MDNEVIDILDLISKDKNIYDVLVLGGRKEPRYQWKTHRPTSQETEHHLSCDGNAGLAFSTGAGLCVIDVDYIDGFHKDLEAAGISKEDLGKPFQISPKGGFHYPVVLPRNLIGQSIQGGIDSGDIKYDGYILRYPSVFNLSFKLSIQGKVKIIKESVGHHIEQTISKGGELAKQQALSLLTQESVRITSIKGYVNSVKGELESEPSFSKLKLKDNTVDVINAYIENNKDRYPNLQALPFITNDSLISVNLPYKQVEGGSQVTRAQMSTRQKLLLSLLERKGKVEKLAVGGYRYVEHVSNAHKPKKADTSNSIRGAGVDVFDESIGYMGTEYLLGLIPVKDGVISEPERWKIVRGVVNHYKEHNDKGVLDAILDWEAEWEAKCAVDPDLAEHNSKVQPMIDQCLSDDDDSIGLGTVIHYAKKNRTEQDKKFKLNTLLQRAVTDKILRNIVFIPIVKDYYDLRDGQVYDSDDLNKLFAVDVENAHFAATKNATKIYHTTQGHRRAMYRYTPEVKERFVDLPNKYGQVIKGGGLNTYIWQNLPKGDADLSDPRAVEHIKILDNIIMSASNGDEKHAEVSRRFLAHAVQFPGVQLKRAMVVSGTSSAGKTTLWVKIMKRMVGEENFASEEGDEKVREKHNTFMADNVVFVAEEADEIASTKAGRSFLKALIGNDAVSINRKGKPILKLRCVTNYVFLSNTINFALHEGFKKRCYAILIDKERGELLGIDDDLDGFERDVAIEEAEYDIDALLANDYIVNVWCTYLKTIDLSEGVFPAGDCGDLDKMAEHKAGKVSYGSIIANIVGDAKYVLPTHVEDLVIKAVEDGGAIAPPLNKVEGAVRAWLEASGYKSTRIRIGKGKKGENRRYIWHKGRCDNRIAKRDIIAVLTADYTTRAGRELGVDGVAEPAGDVNDSQYTAYMKPKQQPNGGGRKVRKDSSGGFEYADEDDAIDDFEL